MMDEKIIRILRDEGTMAVADLAERLGQSPYDITRDLETLQEHGVVHLSGDQDRVQATSELYPEKVMANARQKEANLLRSLREAVGPGEAKWHRQLLPVPGEAKPTPSVLVERARRRAEASQAEVPASLPCGEQDRRVMARERAALEATLYQVAAERPAI